MSEPQRLELSRLPGVEAGIRTVQLQRAVFGLLNPDLADLGLFFRAYATLAAFVQGAKTGGEASRVLGLGDSNLADAVRVLEHSGYITRADAPGAWGRTVTVTADGHAAYRDAAPRAAAAQQRWLDEANDLWTDAMSVMRRLTAAAGRATDA